MGDGQEFDLPRPHVADEEKHFHAKSASQPRAAATTGGAGVSAGRLRRGARAVSVQVERLGECAVRACACARAFIARTHLDHYSRTRIARGKCSQTSLPWADRRPWQPSARANKYRTRETKSPTLSGDPHRKCSSLCGLLASIGLLCVLILTPLLATAGRRWNKSAQSWGQRN